MNPEPTRRVGPSRREWAGVMGLTMFGLLARLLWLAWQPLWWDEGYSVYFATEPLGRMLTLTAQDIHPPLYYALLHGWLRLWGEAGPVALRSLSVLLGTAAIPAFWWMGRTLFPARPGLVLGATGLLAFSPMHIYHSHEVRMYGLLLLLGMVSVGFFWRLVQDPGLGRNRAAWGYILATTGLLYTEYYGALLPLALFAWGIFHWRGRWPALLTLVRVNSLVALLYLPWLIFAIPELIPYIGQKVVEDGDQPLALPLYLWRHLLAFSAGHVNAPWPWMEILRGVAGGAAALSVAFLGVMALSNLRAREPGNAPPAPPSPVPLLMMAVAVPFGVGFGLNLAFPFFPDGGERLLFLSLPYFLMLVAAGIYAGVRLAGWVRWAGLLAGVTVWVGSLAGAYTFHSVPRHVENDYRALIQQVVTQGRETDTVLVIFPWQVGYWRAYAPVWGRGDLHGPWPLLTPQPEWGDAVAQALDQALAQGHLWFPAHLTLGGVLEGAIEGYLMQGMAQGRLVNFENRWYNATTRLSAWAVRSPAQVAMIPADADFGRVRLTGVGDLSERFAASANQVIGLPLSWQVDGSLPGPGEEPLRVVIRLQDESGEVWAERGYVPLGSWSQEQPGAGGDVTEHVGMLIPAGLPPGQYEIAVGIGQGMEGALLPVTLGADPSRGPVAQAAAVTSLHLLPPEERIPPLRLPIQERLTNPIPRNGLDFLGFSGYDPEQPILAGTELALSLFVQNRTAHRQPQAVSQLYVSLLNRAGEGVAGWEGWPLADYPPSLWIPDGLLRLPIRFYLPATLPTGEYRLIAGVMDEAGVKSLPVALGSLSLVQRAAVFAPPEPPQHLVDGELQFGTHARLLGYDLSPTVRADGTLAVTLYWEALQPLLPPHHVFVHLTDDAGAILSQDDGVPGQRAVQAPSGSWLPGEVIFDPHLLIVPEDRADLAGLSVRVGLYHAQTGARLPLLREGVPAGDSARLPLPE